MTSPRLSRQKGAQKRVRTWAFKHGRGPLHGRLTDFYFGAKPPITRPVYHKANGTNHPWVMFTGKYVEVEIRQTIRELPRRKAKRTK